MTSTAATTMHGNASRRAAEGLSNLPLEYLLYATLAGYIILSEGFAQLRIPPNGSFGVPLGELTLLLILSLMAVQVAPLRHFFRLKVAPLFLVWWALAVLTVAVSMQDNGVWALRSATHAIESLYIVIGVAIGVNTAARERFFRFWNIIINATFLYALTFPFQSALLPFSPRLTALAGYSTPLFFNYSHTHIFTLIFAAKTVLTDRRVAPFYSYILALIALLITLIFMQSRTSYGIVLALLGIVAVYYPRQISTVTAATATGLLVLGFVFAFGFEPTGRVGEVGSIDFFARHFLSSFGIVSEGLEGSAGGVAQRLGWWSAIFSQLFANATNLFFGLGQGTVLTDLGSLDGVPVREPHNSLISLFARYGLFGLIAFLWIHVLLYRQLLRNIRVATARGLRRERQRLVTLLFFFVSVAIFSMVEDALEKPFVAIPYYFAWGIAISRPRAPEPR